MLGNPIRLELNFLPSVFLCFSCSAAVNADDGFSRNFNIFSELKNRLTMTIESFGEIWGPLGRA